MNFTREPIVESVVTPREGCKLVIRNSKAGGQEEYFVDAVEVIRFGSALFFRSLERPKSFLLPVTDYEVLEVRETRVVLKHATVSDKGGEKPRTRSRVRKEKEESTEEAKPKRRRPRRRRGAKDDEGAPEGEAAASGGDTAPPKKKAEESAGEEKSETLRTTLIPPPSTLIHENMDRYKEMIAPEKKAEKPVLVAPSGAEVEQEAGKISKGLGVFSASRFLRRLAGGEAPQDAQSSEGSSEES